MKDWEDNRLVMEGGNQVTFDGKDLKSGKEEIKKKKNSPKMQGRKESNQLPAFVMYRYLIYKSIFKFHLLSIKVQYNKFR